MARAKPNAAAKTTKSRDKASARGRKPTVERRAAPRSQPALGTVCRLQSHTGEEFGLGLVWNISTSGLSMLLDRPVPAGTTLAANLMACDGEMKVPRQMRVAHILGLRTGDYMVGCQFLEPLGSEEISWFTV